MKLLVGLIGLLLTFTANANIGSVTELSGAATIKRGSNVVVVTKGTVVEQNDKVETKNGKLKIVFKDNTTVSVTEHSALVIDDFVYDPKSGAGKLALNAAAGTVRYVSGAIAKDPKQVKINTPTAAIAVRGTDFVMSVGETGSSMIILMPSCDDGTLNLKGLVCGSGKIDVESGPSLVSLDKPYQATLVESLNQPPTPPIIVNLFNTPISNNLQIAPPKTLSGANVIAAARAAANATGITKDNKEDKEENKEETQKAATSQQDKKNSKKLEQLEEETTTKVGVSSTEYNKDAVANNVAAVGETENPYLKKLFKDKSETIQVGWLYESLSPNNRNYANVIQPMDTKIQIVITQDMQTNSYSFANRPQGQIVINQNYR